jgi:RNA polymerase sigma factor (sigma-70 family)
MTELDDHELLAVYARTESETAFATLVRRHVSLVHSAALRFTGNAQHAQEITQAVFIILARRAGSLRSGVVLSGWLYQTARLTSANFMRGEIRRQNREQEAYMQATLNEPENAAWEQIAPLLDEAMGRLGEADRNALVLRYFENKMTSEIAATLKMKEPAAHMRIQRALEKLRKFFLKRGLVLSATALAGAVAANSVQAAPTGLAVTVAAGAKGALISAAVTTLVKQTMNTMTWLKLKLAAGAGVAALLAGGLATVAISQSGGGSPPAADNAGWAILQKSRAAYAALQSYSDSGQSVGEIGGQIITSTFNLRLQHPNSYRVEWEQTNQFSAISGVVWSAGNGDYMLVDHGQNNPEPRRLGDRQTALDSVAGLSGGASATVPEAFFQPDQGDWLNYPAATLRQLADEPVGGVDCYVVASVRGPANLPNQAGKAGKTTTTLWIGQQDYLIRQKRKVTESFAYKLPAISDGEIATALTRQNQPATPEAIAAMRKIMDAGRARAEKQVGSGRIVLTETHDHLALNPALTAADFAR